MHNCKAPFPAQFQILQILYLLSAAHQFSQLGDSQCFSLLHSPQCSVPIIHAYSACTFGSIKQNALIELTLDIIHYKERRGNRAVRMVCNYFLSNAISLGCREVLHNSAPRWVWSLVLYIRRKGQDHDWEEAEEYAGLLRL